MKWGRKKHTCESSVGRSSSLISHVLPNSWLLKFKQKSRDVEAKPVKVKRKGKSGLASGDSPKLGTAAVGAGEERFYGGEGDGFWRLSFGEEGVEGNSSNGNMRSFWYDSDNELEAPPSSCHSFRTYARSVIGEADIHKFNNLSLDARKMQGFHGDEKILPEIDEIRRDEKLKEINRRSLEERWPDLERNSYEADEIEHFRRISMMERKHWKLIDADINKHGKTSFKNSRNYNLTTIEEDGSHGISAEKRSSDWEKLKEMKIKEIKSRSEDHRKSVYVSRESQRRTKQNSRVKVSSPRIKALEDMKKAKIKMKKGKEKTREGGTRMESFAVVKCSFDPQKDFRESMIEMIMEKQIRRPEQLEELLACYLTLNSDEYHDLIIKVFRQVWFDLNHSCFNKEI